ncbi:hypothetical protein [Maridesulfovibrio sp.]
MLPLPACVPSGTQAEQEVVLSWLLKVSQKAPFMRAGPFLYFWVR